MYIYLQHFKEKPGILIPDLYFHNIKKKQNHKINTREKQRCYSFFFWAGSSSAHVAGLNPASLAGSLAQTSDPAGHYCSLHA